MGLLCRSLREKSLGRSDGRGLPTRNDRTDLVRASTLSTIPSPMSCPPSTRTHMRFHRVLVDLPDIRVDPWATIARRL